MSDADITGNPFAALFPSMVDVQTFVQGSSDALDYTLPVTEKDLASREIESSATVVSPGESAVTGPAKRTQLTTVLEEVLRVTLEEPSEKTTTERQTSCVLLTAFKDTNKCLDVTTLDEVIFERLVTDEPQSHLVRHGSLQQNSKEEEIASEKRVLFYLYQSFHRLEKYKSQLESEDFASVEKAIISQATTCLCHCEIYPGKKIQEQFFYLLMEYYAESEHRNVLERFLKGCTECIKGRFDAEEEEVSLLEVLSHSFNLLRNRFSIISIANRELFTLLDVLKFFTTSVPMAMALLDFSIPSGQVNFRSFQESLLGSPFCVSCLPRRENDSYEFFERPSQVSAQDHAITESNLWLPLKGLASEVYMIFYSLLRLSPEIKNKTLTWLGRCLAAGADRSKLWNNQMSELFMSVQLGDGFALNLGAVLLKLSKPFSEPYSPKLLKVLPSYCAYEIESEEEANSLFKHIKGLSKETCLVPKPEGMLDARPEAFNFPTECFFATHQALALGFRVVNERLARLSQDLNRIRRVFEDARSHGGETSDVVTHLQENMEIGMTRFLSLKAALLEPDTLEQMLQFHIASATWLCHVATAEKLDKFQTLSLPFPEHGRERLAYVPEFMVENICDCIIFVRRFSEKTLELLGDKLEHLMMLILVFMGSPQRMNNPHLRARLAEMLEALMTSKDEDRFSTLIPNLHREKLFHSHPCVGELVPTLLHVFVSIEMTGQSVTFEQKFHYRRPMYIVLDHLWRLPEHRKKMKQLAKEAEANIECATPPLFLRFINLLINDAIFLLDEALSYMSRLRELQQQRESGAGGPSGTQGQANIQHLGMLAHFHNVMGRETIRTLAWLTSGITSIFCHPTMVDRIAPMLNYFLLHLVGPEKKKLKVKDLNEYEFKPQELVQNICKIYDHLGSPDTTTAHAFCIAVSRDGRSYSPDLFPQAQNVLVRIGQMPLSLSIGDLAKKIQKTAVDQKQVEDAINDAPEEFLDPIMSAIMNDPVTLPSSGIVLDRSTIARHLLSDQTDPFNRSPLTMEMIVPNEDLKRRITEWRAKRGH
ncbi:ubiquitin conjugation factor E4 A-like [Ornithodoros turicata]|uniref:ubiquitin conjugation factor E4 A-like n=1 Tax=Ornithodoros turicata TaxID=34597 RepID=UPI003138BA17